MQLVTKALNAGRSPRSFHPDEARSGALLHRSCRHHCPAAQAAHPGRSLESFLRRQHLSLSQPPPSLTVPLSSGDGLPAEPPQTATHLQPPESEFFATWLLSCCHLVSDAGSSSPPSQQTVHGQDLSSWVHEGSPTHIHARASKQSLLSDSQLFILGRTRT